MARQDNDDSSSSNHRVQGFSSSILDTCWSTLALCAERVNPLAATSKQPPGASITNIIHRFRDLEAYGGGVLYRTLLESIAESGFHDEDLDDDEDDYDSPTACSTFLDDAGDEHPSLQMMYGDIEEQQQQQQQEESRPPPPVRIDRRVHHHQQQRQRLRKAAKRAFLSAVFIEGTKHSAIDDLRETLRKHYVLGKNPFGYAEQTHDAFTVGTRTIPDRNHHNNINNHNNNFPPTTTIGNTTANPAAANDEDAATPASTSNAAATSDSNSIIVLFYYVF